MNADSRVMEYFPKLLTREESDTLIARIEERFERSDFGLWAVEVVDSSKFAGFIGLSVPHFQAHFTPCIEIGWRLAAEFWGRGLATEGARAVLAFAFESLSLDQIVSFTTAANIRSRRVMEKLGMTHDPSDDFDHPLLIGHPLQRHVLYRIELQRWQSTAGTR